MTVMAYDPARRTNAQAIADAHELGYINDDEVVLDLTYERGRFWKQYRPDMLCTNDLNPKMDTLYHEDFRDFHIYAEERQFHFDTIVFDPPYAFRGTSKHAMDESYGLGEYLTVNERLRLLADGMRSASLMLDPGSILLFKLQDQVVSGEKVWQRMLMADHGADIGLRLVDELHVVGYRAQPQRKCKVCGGKGAVWNPEITTTFNAVKGCPDCGGSGKVDMVQKHSASNVSTLQIYRKVK